MPALVGSGLTGCGHDGRTHDQGSDTSAGGETANGIGGQGGASRTPTCGESTAANIEGPFFQLGSPERTNIRAEEPGPRLLLTGIVTGLDCRPIEGALLDFWQADEDGVYDNEGAGFRGFQYTNARGEYELQTIIPGRYLNGSQFRPAHIHVKVTVGEVTLTTQLYFPGDPFNEVDAFIDFSLIVHVDEQRDDVTFASYDFVLG